MSGASERARRARRAAELLDDPVLGELLGLLESRCQRRWLDSRPEDQALRERLWQEARLVQALRGELLALLADGAIENERERNRQEGNP